MISIKQKDLLHKMLEYALRNGAKDCRISFSASSESSFEYLNKDLDKLQQSQGSQLQIDLFVEGRYGSFSTNRIDEKELMDFIKRGIENVRYLAKDECRTLPDPSLYFKGVGDDLKQCDPKFETIPTEEKLRVARENVLEVLGKDKRIISVTGGYGDEWEDYYMLTSNGFEGETSSSSFGITVQISLKGEGDARPQSYWYDYSILWDNLQKKGIGEEALQRCLMKLNPQKIKSGKYQMLLDNRSWRKLLSPILSAINGVNLQQNNSFLLNKLNEKVFSVKLSIVDNPHIVGAVGARWFDGEGMATQKRSIIEKGVLKTYYINTYSSKKLNVPPTATGPSTWLFKLGNKDFKQLLKGLDKGVWVTSFNGGNSNSTTGDFSFGVEGFWIENGEIVKPVSEMNITGNFISLFTNLDEIGNDPYLDSSIQTPSIIFSSVDFSGE